jgi:hypothetical protein
MVHPLVWVVWRAFLGAVLGLLAAGIVLALMIPAADRLGYAAQGWWIGAVLAACTAAGVLVTRRRRTAVTG